MIGFKHGEHWFSTALFCVLAVAANRAGADQVSVPAAQFNTLFQVSDPNFQTSGGASQYIFAGLTDDMLLRRGLIAFDVSSFVPADATVSSVNLTLWFDKSKSTAPLPASLYRMTKFWGEGTSPTGITQGGGGGNGSLATQDDATWLYTFYNAANPAASPTWTNPGGDGDYITTASATATIQGGQGTLTPYTWSGPGLVADVQAWLQNPLSNDGWMLKGDESESFNTAMRFQSADTPFDGTNSTVDALPVLTITYSTPEPGTLGLMSGIGAFLALARRRRA